MNELTEHYVEIIRAMERSILSRAPRLCKPKGLSDDEVRGWAAAMAHAHLIAPYALSREASA